MKKFVAGAVAGALVINMILLGLGKISILWFWLIVIAGALFAFKVLPRIH